MSSNRDFFSNMLMLTNQELSHLNKASPDDTSLRFQKIQHILITNNPIINSILCAAQRQCIIIVFLYCYSKQYIRASDFLFQILNGGPLILFFLLLIYLSLFSIHSQNAWKNLSNLEISMFLYSLLFNIWSYTRFGLQIAHFQLSCFCSL